MRVAAALVPVQVEVRPGGKLRTRSVVHPGVLRIPTHLAAGARSSARTRGKSDSIDAVNVARAALQECLETFPAAHLAGPELDLRLLTR